MLLGNPSKHPFIRMDNVRYMYHDQIDNTGVVKFYLEPKEVKVANLHPTFISQIKNPEDYFIHNISGECLVVKTAEIDRLDNTGGYKVILKDQTVMNVHQTSYNLLYTHLNS